MHAVGIDGCGNGWLATIAPDLDLTLAYCIFHPRLEVLLSQLPVERFIIIDIPLGLTKESARRSCDESARKFIGPRRHSVFSPPIRSASLVEDYQTANKINKQKTGAGISKQAWMINNKIKEARKAWDNGHKLSEGHPECSFTRLKGEVLNHSKKSLLGFFERLALLSELGFKMIDLSKCLPSDIRAQPDDLLDSLILCWSASKHILNEGTFLGTSDLTSDDDKGIPMIIHV